MKRRTIKVDVPGAEYPIYLGRGCLDEPRCYPPAIRRGPVLVVSNETVAPLYLDQLLTALHPARPEVQLLPDGERYKTMSQCQRVIDTMLRVGLGRDASIIALGGGVVGDLAGFAAAIYQRGIRFMQVPTTLLAQVDSSVGGKTAVNHPRGKNMIGAFHQPVAVLADINTLETLPDRELSAGLAEVIKYGLIGDARFFNWLQRNISALVGRDEASLIRAIGTSCQHKARVVAADEREAGQRALLNLGHTFGHAIEAHLKYREWLHGEAVATGMLMAADLSRRHGHLTIADVERIEALLTAAALPTRPPPGLSAGRMLKLMAGDKKVAAGRIRLVLLNRVGEAYVSGDYDDALLQQTLQEFCS